MSAIDTIMADIAKVARLIEPALAVVAIAQAATGIGGLSAEEAIKAITAAVRAFEQGATGALSPDVVMADLAKLQQGLAANDATADAALTARFPSV